MLGEWNTGPQKMVGAKAPSFFGEEERGRSGKKPDEGREEGREVHRDEEAWGMGNEASHSRRRGGILYKRKGILVGNNEVTPKS